MRILILSLCLLVTTSTSCLAGYNFNFYYYAYGSISGSSGWGNKVIFASWSSYTDGDDGEAQLQYDGRPIGGAIRKVYGVDGWDGETGLYINDYRSPLSAGQTKTEEIYLWAYPSAQTQNILFYLNGAPYLSPGVSYSLFLVSWPEGITYTGPTQWGPDHGTIILPFYSTDDPLTGYRFRAELTAIPEPCSLLALASGAVLAGMIGRRQRARRS